MRQKNHVDNPPIPPYLRNVCKFKQKVMQNEPKTPPLGTIYVKSHENIRKTHSNTSKDNLAPINPRVMCIIVVEV